MAAESTQAPPPAWVDKAFVEAALRKKCGEDVSRSVEKIEIQHANPKGDNYCSVIFRVTAILRGSTKPLVILVKCLPEGGEWAELVNESRLFAKESQVFSSVLPTLEALLEEAAPGRFPPFAAQCYHHGQEPSSFLVLQDLRPDGYKMADRLEGLDLDHAMLAMRALARLHGASAALWKRRPELFDGLISIFDDTGSQTRSTYYPKSLERTGNTIASWTDFPAHYGEKVLSLVEKIFPKLQEINRRRPEKLNVLIHGDFWTSNLLFRYENNIVQDIRLVDFQLTHVGNPAIDLLLFRYTSLTEEVFDHHWDDLLEIYLGALAETMCLLGEKPPSLEDIQEDMKEGQAYAILASMIWLPSIKIERGKLDLDNVIANDSAKKNVHRSPILCHWLRKLLPILDQNGTLDCL